LLHIAGRDASGYQLHPGGQMAERVEIHSRVVGGTGSMITRRWWRPVCGYAKQTCRRSRNRGTGALKTRCSVRSDCHRPHQPRPVSLDGQIIRTSPGSTSALRETAKHVSRACSTRTRPALMSASVSHRSLVYRVGDMPGRRSLRRTVRRIVRRRVSAGRSVELTPKAHGEASMWLSTQGGGGPEDTGDFC